MRTQGWDASFESPEEQNVWPMLRNCDRACRALLLSDAATHFERALECCPGSARHAMGALMAEAPRTLMVDAAGRGAGER